MRLGELEGIVGEEGGYTAESRRRHAARRPGHRRSRCTSARWANCRAARRSACCWRRRCSAIPPRCCWTSLPTTSISIPSTGCRIICAHTRACLIVISHDRHFLNERLHAHRGYRLRNHHHVHRRLRRHGARQDADPLAHRSAERAARKEDRAVERIHRALLGRHAVLPGDVAQEGSGAPADFGTGASRISSALTSASR